MKPDRFDKMVERHAPGWEWRDQQVAIQMLRSQHAAYVRMVKTMPCIYADATGFCGANNGGCSVNREALLAAFARYKEGTP